MRIGKQIVVFVLTLSLASPSFASSNDTVTGDTGTDVAVDILLLRPLGLVSTVVGGAVFVLGLPFTLPSGDVGKSACELVKRPAAYTFTRPLGDLDGCSGPGCDPCDHSGSAGQH